MNAGPSEQRVRIETDSLGTVEVPAHALYGARTVRAIDNLSFSGRKLGSCPAYVRALGFVKRAAARANRDASVLEAEIADAIDVAAGRLGEGELLEHFPVDLIGGGGSIGVHVNVNEVIANLANEARGGRRGEYSPVRTADVGASQSTADVCHTALRLALLAQWPVLATALKLTRTILKEKAGELAGVQTLARTCLRDAGAVSLGMLFAGYAALLERRTQELQRSIAQLQAISLGGTVIGTGDGAPARYRERVVPILAQIAEMDLERRANLGDALQNSDDVAAVSNQLRLLAGALVKIAADLRLLSSGPRGGFGEIELPVVQEGSTFFAGKANPVVAETVMQCAFQVFGCDRAVQAANEHAELYLNVFDGLAAVNVLDAMAMLSPAITLLESRCLRGLTADSTRCAELAAMAHGK
jgi:aspartate ammonia-lyase